MLIDAGYGASIAFPPQSGRRPIHSRDRIRAGTVVSTLFPAVTGAPITSPPMRAIGVPHALTFATGGRKGFATQSGNALRCRPRSAARLFVLCVFRLNANPAFSVRANVSGNIQSARVSVIHRAVAVPPFWRALS